MKYKAQFDKKKLGTIPDNKVLTSWFNDLNGTQAKNVKRLNDIDGNLTLELDNITDDRLLSTKGFIKTFGKCPESGCVEKDKDGNWRVISNKTGKYWPQTYDSEQDAKDAIKAYHANKGFTNMNKDRKSFANRIQKPDKDIVDAISAKFQTPDEFVYAYNAYLMGKLKDKDKEMNDWFESLDEDKLDAANDYYLVNERVKKFAKELQSIRRKCSTDVQKKAFNELLEAFRGCNK